jgi:hypothetical protein
MSIISNIALGIYGTGIVVSSIIGIREQNLKIFVWDFNLQLILLITL